MPNIPATPLAEKLRPEIFEDVFGQEHLLGENGKLATLLKKTWLPSLILWGPPGCGKTTIARILATKTGAVFKTISAIFSGVVELKQLFSEAETLQKEGKRFLLFVDEIHRFNKAQQDAFLPVVESGLITLIGATTENPSFALGGALLSRCQVLTLAPLGEDALLSILKRYEHKAQKTLPLHDEKARQKLISLAAGDGRYLVNMIEVLENYEGNPLDEEALGDYVTARFANYDKAADYHYNLISALHKSLRGSDEQAALYWFFRMLEGGEDPLYITRRLIRFASEDIGMADPNALLQALAARESYAILGSPEGELAIVQAIIYLATAPKSNALYMAQKKAQKAAEKTKELLPPKHILNAPTSFMKKEGYGKGYIYDHDTAEGFSGQGYFPEAMPKDFGERPLFYTPKEIGFERDIIKRLLYWEKKRDQKRNS